MLVKGLTAAQAATFVTATAIMTLVASANVFIETQKLIEAREKKNADAHEYARQKIVNEENALRQLNKARELEQSILEDLDTKKRLQNDAEYQELQAKQRLAESQEAYNNILKDSAATDDQKRMKALELAAAQNAYNDAIKKHEEAVKATNEVDKQRYDNMLTGLNTQNQLINKTILEDKRYGLLAKRLDELKNKTITYKNAQGELVTKTKEEMAEQADIYAEMLKNTDSTWKAIVRSAQENGTSYVEAARNIGKIAGKDQQQYFAQGIDQYTPYVLDASEASISKVTKQVQDSINKKHPNLITTAVDTGIKMAGGLIAGLAEKLPDIMKNVDVMSNSIIGRFARNLQIKSPSRVFMKFGQQIDQGLINGLDSYEDRVESKATELADSVVSPFSKDAQLDLSGNGVARFNRNPVLAGERYSPGASVVQNNIFNQVADDLDVKEASKLLGFEVATAI